ncbi:MAG TPA: HD domain-containing protein [Hyphomicrobiales bacterium]|nr:HD domain-containing protein [Hyphomicrobiales bacterium]
MRLIDDIICRLTREGGRIYDGEAVNQLEHALQCAALARRESAPDALVVAALLHDYGHVLSDGGNTTGRRIAPRHEDVAARHLAAVFPAAVTEPIRLHVAAKRYLCTIDPDYRDALTPASRASLKAQGGPFDEDGVHIFKRSRFWGDAVRLRQWDDMAKVAGLRTPGLATYRGAMVALAERVAAVA